MARPTGIGAALPGIVRFTRHFAPYLREQRGLIVTAMAALLGQALFRLLEPWPLKFIIDRIVDDSGNTGRLDIDYLAGLDTTAFLTIVATALMVITGFRALFG